MNVTGGSTDVTTYFALRLAADGTAATGLTITNFDLQYVRTGAAPSTKADATALGTTDAAHGDNQAIEVDATNQPGLYRVDWPDAAFAAGVKQVILTVKCATCFTEHLAVDIDPPVNATKISGSSTAADNAEVVFDTDFATNYNTTNDKWQTEADVLTIEGTDATDALDAASPTVDLNADQSGVTIGTVNALATDSVDAAALAADAIAEINATVDTALSDIKLDKLVSSSSTLSSDLTTGCIIDQVMSIDGIGDYDRTTDSLEAIGYQANLITANTSIESTTITAGDTFELVQGSDKDITVSVAVSAIDLSSGSPTVKIGLTKINSNSETSAPGTIDGTINNAGVVGSQSVTFSFPKATTGDMAVSDYSNRIKSQSPRVDNAYQYTIVAHDYPSASKCTPVPNGQGYVKVLEADGAGCA